MIERMLKMKSYGARVGVVVALLAMLGLGACSQSPSSPSGKDEAGSGTQSSEVAQSEEGATSQVQPGAYFEALASNDPVIMAQAVELAVPGSDAEAYAVYLTATAQAEVDSGYTKEPRQVKEIWSGFAMCGDSDGQGESCSEYTHVEYQGDLIENFDAGGSPLTGRISLGDGEFRSMGDGGEIAFVAAYHSIAGDVVAVFELISHRYALWPTATYVSPGNRQHIADSGIGPRALNREESATYAFYFKDAKFGGDVTVSATDGNGWELESVTFATQ